MTYQSTTRYDAVLQSRFPDRRITQVLIQNHPTDDKTPPRADFIIYFEGGSRYTEQNVPLDA